MEGHQPPGPEKPQWDPPTQPTGGWQPPPTQQWQAAPPPPPPPPQGPPPPAQQGGRNPWPLFALAALVLLLIAGIAIAALGGGEDEAEAQQTVRFQQPTEPGPDPFTKRTDVSGPDKVKVGSGPFGGTGSDLVCDRDLLISSLRARPDRLRAWARIVGIEPTVGAVTRYIRTLRPYTLTRDTRVTNHSFVDGRAVAFQSILQAGTAVLVDKDGKPVARCRCGNPLLEPIFIEEAKCIYCPANYTPPPPCSDYADCYRRYPHPPPVVIYARPRREREPERDRPPTTRTGNGPASGQFSPAGGTIYDTYTLNAYDFRPNSTVSVTLTRPDGVSESYSISTDSGGDGSYTFPRASNPPTGTYVARLSDGNESARALVVVTAGGGEGDPQGATDDIPESQQNPSAIQPSEDQNNNGIRDREEVGGGGSTDIPNEGSQCNPPRSQLEAELCAQRGE